MTKAEKRVLDAARKWWRVWRPVAWTKKEHLLHPAVNLVAEASRKLAFAVADLERGLTKAKEKRR